MYLFWVSKIPNTDIRITMVRHGGIVYRRAQSFMVHSNRRSTKNVDEIQAKISAGRFGNFQRLYDVSDTGRNKRDNPEVKRNGTCNHLKSKGFVKIRATVNWIRSEDSSGEPRESSKQLDCLYYIKSGHQVRDSDVFKRLRPPKQLVSMVQVVGSYTVSDELCCDTFDFLNESSGLKVVENDLMVSL